MGVDNGKVVIMVDSGLALLVRRYSWLLFWQCKQKVLCITDGGMVVTSDAS